MYYTMKLTNAGGCRLRGRHWDRVLFHNLFLSLPHGGVCRPLVSRPCRNPYDLTVIHITFSGQDGRRWRQRRRRRTGGKGCCLCDWRATNSPDEHSLFPSVPPLTVELACTYPPTTSGRATFCKRVFESPARGAERDRGIPQVAPVTRGGQALHHFSPFCFLRSPPLFPAYSFSDLVGGTSRFRDARRPAATKISFSI